MTAPRIVPMLEAQVLFGHGTKAELAAAARELAASVVALHAQVARLTCDDYELARRIADAAIAAERERIVAWLRDVDPTWADEYWTPVRQGLRYAADRIEVGAHVAEVKP